MRNIALGLSYDGTAYHGWQKQKNAVSVSEVLQRAIESVCGDCRALTGCGRTDAGVHAKNYCANFRTSAVIPSARLPQALNANLPADIAVFAACDAPEDFCAIRSCVEKAYVYRILNTRVRDPLLRRISYFYPAVLDVCKMQRAARAFVGTHDFAAVRSRGTETKSTVRTVYDSDVEKAGGVISIRVCADGFLYNKARTIAGTLLYVGRGKIAPEDVPALLLLKDRRLTGPTLPPEGLMLAGVWYKGIVGEMFGCEE
ncbi:MAG: tRNA pseudouridine(38-40) synthase TruA [Firmicutes bacterium]|nr:tRNA pseudouridine(38-40) synthase TruA [Bacillota bacterium]